MRIVTDHSGEYKDVINSYYDLEKYDDGSDMEVLFQGYKASRDNALKDRYRGYKKRAYINLEAPCSFTSTLTSIEEQNYFSHVYSICPYTCDWLNGVSETMYIPIPFPYSASTGVVSNDKEYDAMYMGTLMNTEHHRIINVLREFKYVHTALQKPRGSYRPTHLKISSAKKLNLLSKSRVSVAMNLAPITLQHVKMITQYNDWRSNEAFSNLKRFYIPQFKPRVIESMICKTLVLVKRDWWSVIEKWFIPGMHFIYWDDFKGLRETIADVRDNYGDYVDVVENAYEKVKEYEINKIYENVICK